MENELHSHKKRSKVKESETEEQWIMDKVNILENIQSLFTQRCYTDVTIVVDSKEYDCHRLILSATSDVLQVMLMNPHWVESGKARVVLVETKECASIFEDFIKYFYTGRMLITLKTALPILILADKYNVKHLISSCISYMISHTGHAALAGTLIPWHRHSVQSDHHDLAKACEDFAMWNLEDIYKNCDFYRFDEHFLIFLLKQSDLVVHDEMTLYRYVVSWLNAQSRKIKHEEKIKELVVSVMSHIRFFMFTPRQVADLLLCPLTSKYKDFFVTQMRNGMIIHSGDKAKMTELYKSNICPEHFTPRLYTSNSRATLLTIERVPCLPLFHKNTLVFSSTKGVTDGDSQGVIEWVAEVYPKGISIERCYLIRFDGKKEVPAASRRVFRLSITCKERWFACKPPMRIAILIYGRQNDIEQVISVTQRIYKFTEEHRVLHIDNLIPYADLHTLLVPQNYLVGPDTDMLKMHIIIEPVTCLPTN